jgi:hypothetical protein
MNDMMVKAKKEKQAEKERFAAFSQFCKDTTAGKQKAIERGAADIEKAASNVAEADADATRLGDEISAHDAAIAQWSTDKKSAIELRKEQHRAFEREHAQVVDAEEASIAAKKTLEDGNQAKAQAALLQLSKSPRVPAHMKKTLSSFMQIDSPALVQEVMAGTPEAAAFEGKSGAIIGVIDDLTVKEHDYKKEIEDAEANRLNAHNLLVNSLEGDIKKAEMMMSQKASVKAEKEQDRASAKSDLNDATSARKEDQKYLSDLNAECTLKTQDFQKRQVMRQQEIEAIMKAEEIMRSPDVANGGASLAQRPTSLAQLRSDGATNRHPGQHIAARFLAERAKKINSQVLSLIATHAAEDPFGKVTGMVKNMIKKLMEEANEEADHKGFCDAEMGTNKMTRDAKTAQVAELESSIQEFSADINELALQITQTSTAISEVDAAVAEATSERDAEKEKNQETISDTKLAQSATQKAMQVLKEFYDKAANQVDLPEARGPIKYDPRSLQILSKSTGASLLQTSVPGAPEMESGKYTGMGNGGVIGMLEVIESDFAAVIADTTASEAESARVFEQFLNDSNQDKAVKNTELNHRRNKQTQKESDLQQAKNDLKTAQAELQGAVDYYQKLKPTCVEVAMSYADRKAARESEIDSLQEALTILSQDDIA